MKKNIPRLRIQEESKIKKLLIALFIFISARSFALDSTQILVITNSDVNESVQLAEYYCQKRAVPKNNILKIPLGKNLSEKISRVDYNNILAPAIKNEIKSNRKPYEIKCLLTTYGVPIKVGQAPPFKNSDELSQELTKILSTKEDSFRNTYQKLQLLGRKEMINPEQEEKRSIDEILKKLPEEIKKAQDRIKYVEGDDLRKKQYDELINLLKLLNGPIVTAQQAQKLPQNSFTLSISEKSELYKNDKILKTAQEEKWPIEKKLKENLYASIEAVGGLTGVLSYLKSDLDRIQGRETGASVDSELSMVMFDEYDLYRWQPNELKDSLLLLPGDTLMVSRLDGPSLKIAERLIDKAIQAEKSGLKGIAYVDARGMNITGQLNEYSYEYYDKNLNSLASMLRSRTKMKVIFENTSQLFAPGSCPQTAIYCGWYSVKKYIDAFTFVPGAVGYHIASFEAQDLRNAGSSNWCPAMLSHGITATLGPVDEPYLHAFPLPLNFFSELLDGKCLVEAYYITNPYNSWQLVLIGDPLYKLNIK